MIHTTPWRSSPRSGAKPAVARVPGRTGDDRRRRTARGARAPSRGRPGRLAGSSTPVSTPAGATIVKNRINSYNKPGGNAGGTNWDRGIYQVAQSTSTFDVAVVITDGNPTFYGAGEGPGNRTRFREVENGIFSANAVKAEDTKVIAFGVGDGIASPQRREPPVHLRDPTAQHATTTRPPTTPPPVTQLRALALGNCTGLGHRGQAGRPLHGPAGRPRAPQPGRRLDVRREQPGQRDHHRRPTSGITATGTGAANFPLTFAGGTTSGNVTLTETQQSGYTLQQVGGFNAVCTRLDTDAARRPSPTTAPTASRSRAAIDVPGQLHRLQPGSEPAGVGRPEQDLGDQRHRPTPRVSQPAGFIAFGTINGTNQPWGVPRTGFRQGDSRLAQTRPSVTRRPVHPGLEPAHQRERDDRWIWHCRPNQTLAGGTNTYGITNVLTCPTQLTLDKTVRFGTDAAADVAGPSTLSRRAARCLDPWDQPGQPGPRRPSRPGVIYPLAESGGPPEYAQFVAPNADPIPGSTGSWTCSRGGQGRHHSHPRLRRRPQRRRHRAVRHLGSLHRRQPDTPDGLVKEVVNDNGGTAVPAAWDLRPLRPEPSRPVCRW